MICGIKYALRKVVDSMMDPATAYFLKKYYPHVIKWWLVLYNPEYIRIWPSKAEEDEALRLEAEEQKQLTDHHPISGMNSNSENLYDGIVDDAAYNVTTGSYSGLYGQKPVDADTQAALDAIMNSSSNQSSIDFLLSGGTPTSGPAYAMTDQAASDVVIPPEQAEIIAEANAIYERLLREAAEDEAKKQAEIEEARRQAQQQFASE